MTALLCRERAIVEARGLARGARRPVPWRHARCSGGVARWQRDSRGPGSARDEPAAASTRGLVESSGDRGGECGRELACGREPIGGLLRESDREDEIDIV